MKKNTTTIERVLRLIVGLALVIFAILRLSAPLSIGVGAVGIVLVFTALSGYCPMCHVAGRKNIE